MAARGSRASKRHARARDPKLYGFLVTAVVTDLLLATSPAHADPPWASRRMTLGDGEFAGDVGVGLADDSQVSVTGTGLYLQAGYGLTSRIELLVRDGYRIGEYSQYARAEQYGRLYTTDGAVTPGPGRVSNPDLVFLARVVDVGFLEIGAEAEAGFPIEPHTDVDTTFGVPVTFHYPPWVRFDTGAFVTLTYGDPVTASFTAPFELWFQTGRFPLWFGPLTAVTVSHSGVLSMPFGVGVGYAVNSDIDIRAQWLLPKVNEAPGINDMGFGIGVEIRIPRLGRAAPVLQPAH